MNRTLVCYAVALAALSQERQQPPPEDAAVRATDGRRFRAMTAGDVQTLDQLLASELTYIHASGDLDTKASLLAALHDGRLKYEAIAPTDVHVRLYGATAIVTGRSRMRVRTAGQTHAFAIRFTEVYAEQGSAGGGAWRLVAWQATRLP